MLKKLANQSASSWRAEGRHETAIRQWVLGLTNAKVGAAKSPWTNKLQKVTNGWGSLYVMCPAHDVYVLREQLS